MKLKTLRTIILPCLIAAGASSIANAAHIWINEFHYDNNGTDVGEFVEIALSTPNMTGFTAADYSVILYNGFGGTAYDTRSLDTFSSTGPLSIVGSASQITLFTFTYQLNGIQNGSPDGIALVNTTNNTVESFLSYEGSFTAVGGIANGVISTDVGVIEGASLGTSLAASGQGFSANQFGASSYVLATTATPGAINQGQTFTTIPEPSAALLGGLGLLALLRRRR